MGLRKQIVDDEKIYMEFTDGSNFTFNLDVYRTFFQNQQGTLANRIRDTINKLKNDIIEALGDKVDPDLIYFEFEHGNGRVREFTIGGI